MPPPAPKVGKGGVLPPPEPGSSTGEGIGENSERLRGFSATFMARVRGGKGRDGEQGQQGPRCCGLGWDRRQGKRWDVKVG